MKSARIIHVCWNPWILGYRLTYGSRDKMATFSQTIFSDAFSWMKSFVFWSKFHLNLFLRVQLTTRQIRTPVLRIPPAVTSQAKMKNWLHECQQGKSEGFESCDWPIVRKRPIWVKIGDALYRVTLKFDRWPWKTIGHLSFAVSSFVQHFIAIGEFKLELQSGNAHFGSNSTIFRAVWPWNLRDDLEKQ